MHADLKFWTIQLFAAINDWNSQYMYTVPVPRSACQLLTQREDATLGAQDNRCCTTNLIWVFSDVLVAYRNDPKF